MEKTVQFQEQFAKFYNRDGLKGRISDEGIGAVDIVTYKGTAIVEFDENKHPDFKSDEVMRIFLSYASELSSANANGETAKFEQGVKNYFALCFPEINLKDLKLDRATQEMFEVSNRVLSAPHVLIGDRNDESSLVFDGLKTQPASEK